jgi:hypothetical protein
MSVTYRIDAAGGIVFTEVHGRVNGDDLLEYQRRLGENPAFEPSYRHLVDLSDLDGADVSVTAMRRLVEGHPFQKGAPHAFVVISNLASVLIRMFRIFASESTDSLQTFPDVVKAREWLGC